MQIERKKASIPFFSRGDVGGLTYMVTNNIVNYIIIIAALKASDGATTSSSAA